MHPLQLEFWVSNQRILGVLAIVVGLGAWATEWADLVYICPYCRVQRTVVVVLGVLMQFPSPRFWLLRYVAAVVGFFGAVVAANQHFMSWAKVSSGEFSWGAQWYIHPFLLSGAALFIILAQVWLLSVASSPTPQASPGEK